MSLKIRLRRQGKTNRPFYRLVVADSRLPRDGKYVESLGWYNPIETRDELHLEVRADRVQHWLDQGAQPTEKALHLIARASPETAKAMMTRKQERYAKQAAKRKKKSKA